MRHAGDRNQLMGSFAITSSKLLIVNLITTEPEILTITLPACLQGTKMINKMYCKISYVQTPLCIYNMFIVLINDVT